MIKNRNAEIWDWYNFYYLTRFVNDAKIRNRAVFVTYENIPTSCSEEYDPTINFSLTEAVVTSALVVELFRGLND